MSWKVAVFASLDGHNISKNAAVIGVNVRNKKGIALEDGCVSFRRGTLEPDGATAMVDIDSSSDRTLDQKAKKLSLVVKDLDTGVNHFIPTDGEYDVEEVY